MSRISLRETYDNRSVIAQIAKVTDTAEDAAETVEQKAAEINDAITEVNAAVQAAEGAVTTANAASASAQQSAQTVAGYENRLGAVEGDVVQLNTDVDGIESDLNAVTLRVQTAEGDIVTIQGRVTALETADGQNVKLTGTNAIGNYAVLLTGNQENITGIKGFLSRVYARDPGEPVGQVGGSLTGTHSNVVIMSTIKINYNTVIKFSIVGSANNANYFESEYVFAFSRSDSTPVLYCVNKRSNSTNNAPFLYFVVNDDTVTFYGLTVQYTAQTMYVESYRTYGLEYDPASELKMKLATNAGTVVPLPENAVAEITLENRL